MYNQRERNEIKRNLFDSAQDRLRDIRDALQSEWQGKGLLSRTFAGLRGENVSQEAVEAFKAEIDSESPANIPKVSTTYRNYTGFVRGQVDELNGLWDDVADAFDGLTAKNIDRYLERDATLEQFEQAVEMSAFDEEGHPKPERFMPPGHGR